jgi:hypothetical protein
VIVESGKEEIMKKQLIVIFLILMLSPTVTWAANHYIRSGASGSTCADWGANACKALPSTLVRGDTYYIASGTYAGRSFNTAVSGSAYITIKGATASDHGIETGWSNTYSVSTSDGGSQAIFTGQIIFGTSYWIFDGSVGPTWSKTPSQYGFIFSGSYGGGYSSAPIRIYGSGTQSYITLSHLAATAPSGDTEKMMIATQNMGNTVTNVTIDHIYSSGWQGTIYAPCTSKGDDLWIIQYSTLLNAFSSSTNHGEYLNNNGCVHTNMTVRWNWFEGGQNGTGVVVANNANNNNVLVYGNVFKDITEGNGIITGTSTGNLSNVLVYNNTFINCSSGGWIGDHVTGSAYNNLLYNMSASTNSSITHDYNAYFSTSNTPSESNNQTGSGSPFVNVSSNNLNLTSATSSGINLSSPYNMDANGNTRGADGTWDRGALEYASGKGGVTTYTVTPSAGPNGSMYPNAPQSVSNGLAISFDVTPNGGYAASVGGTCGGTLSGSTYTTKAVTADCTVLVTFTAIDTTTRPSPPPSLIVN